MLSAIWLRRFQYLFLAIIVTTVGFSLYQWNASRAALTVTQKSAPGNGLVGYWSFDDGAGTQAGDASGNGNTGTLTNGPTWVTGKLGKAVSFDGVDDYVSATNVGNIQTISYWIKSNSQANGGIELNADQYITDNAIPEGFANSTVYIDGVLQSSLYGSELVTNGNMESAGSWSGWGPPLSQAQSSDTAHSGTYSRKTVTCCGYEGIYQDIAGLSGSTQYKMSFWQYGSSGIDSYGILNVNGSDVFTLGFGTPTDTWKYYKGYGTTPASVPTARVMLISQNGAMTRYFDDVSLKQVLTRYPLTDTTKWHHIVITTTTAVNASAVKIGKGGTSYLNGSLDEVRIYNRALSGTEVTNLYNLGIEKLNVSATPSPASGLVGWWTFDGNDMTDTLAYDRSGQGNTGTLTNGPSKTIGYLGQGLSFDGVDDYVQASNAASLQFANATSITLSAWINPSQVTSYGTVLIKGRDTDNNEANYALRQSSTGKKLEFYYNESGNTNYHVWTTTSDVFLTANQWYHVAVTYTFGTGASIKAYINGENYTGSWIGGTGNSAPDVSTQVLTIGRKKSVTGGAELFTGSIDDVRIYNTALTASQVADLYNGGKVVLNSTKKIYITTVGAGTFSAPADWPGTADKVEVIGGGAAGGYGYYWSGLPGAGGGGGAYAKKSNLAITNGASLQVGGGGSGGAGAAGGDTWIVSTGTVKAAGAPGHAVTVAGTGGAAASSVGDVVYSGGNGNSTLADISIGGAGGGGAAGPSGAGKNGGYSGRSGCCGPVGGGGGGGASGGLSTAGVDSGGAYGPAPGGVGPDGTAGGVANSNGSHGSGGGGGGDGSVGRQGGDGVEWDSTHGAGGGGGGGGAGGSSYNGGAGGAGGSYGGGGGGGGQDGFITPDKNDGGNGGQGIIVITYTPL